MQANAPRNNVSHTDFINKRLAKSYGTILLNKDCICASVPAHSFACTFGSGTLLEVEGMYTRACWLFPGVEVVCISSGEWRVSGV